MEEKILEILFDIQKDMKEVKERLSNIEERLTILEEKITALEEKVAALEKEVIILRGEINILKEKFADQENELISLKNQRMIDSHNIAQILKVQIEMSARLNERCA